MNVMQYLFPQRLPPDSYSLPGSEAVATIRGPDKIRSAFIDRCNICRGQHAPLLMPEENKFRLMKLSTSQGDVWVKITCVGVGEFTIERTHVKSKKKQIE